MGDSEYYIASSANILVDRIRVFYHFETPFIIKCTEEITFFNAGRKIESILYDLGEFKSHLHIIDTNGEDIEFHSLRAAQMNDLLSTYPEDQIINKKYIIIDFPKNRPLEAEDYRTIKMDYIKEISSKEIPSYSRFVDWGQFTIPLGNSQSTYLYSNKPKKYLCKSNFQIIFDDNGIQQQFDITNLDEIGNIILEDEDNYSQIAIMDSIKNCTLQYSFSIYLHPLQKHWFDFGAYVGYGAAVLYVFLFAINFDMGVKIGVPLGAAVIAFLTITKGWLFTQDMDRIVNLMQRREGRKITYDEVYLLSIGLIFMELIILGIFVVAIGIYDLYFIPHQELIVNSCNNTSILNCTIIKSSVQSQNICNLTDNISKI